MQLHSDRWAAAIVESHAVVVAADCLLAGSLVAEGLALTSGSVVLDRTAQIRGRLSATLVEPLRLPGSSLDTLGPGGYELAIRRGIRYADGSEEFMPLGVYPIQQATLSDRLVTSVSAMDRAQTVADARLEADYVIAAGTNYATAIAALLLDGVPWLTLAFPSTTYTTPALTFPAQTDRWKAAQDMAKSIGCELHFDGLGRCVMSVEPDPNTTQPVWAIAEGPRGTLTAATFDRDRASAYNRVIAYSVNPGGAAVYRGVATDSTPSSPTYYFGPFGRKPRFFASEFIGSDAQALSAAQSILNANLGVARGVSLDAVPNPALEPGDAITVTRAAMGVVDEVHLIDALSIDLSASGRMSLTSRARREE